MAESLRIVIVDDSEAMRGVLLRALKSFGWKVMVVEARGAREALDKIRDSRPHLVITDWSMPEVSGLELLSYDWDQKCLCAPGLMGLVGCHVSRIQGGGGVGL